MIEILRLRTVLALFAGAAACVVATAAEPGLRVLEAKRFVRHVDYFNHMEDEPVVNVVPNAQAWDWMVDNVPFFECPDAEVEEIYFFRWWALRKHLRKTKDDRFVFTEFITRERPVSSALGHHLMEGRWLRNQAYHDDYVLYWLRGHSGKPQEHLHKYSSWLQHALYQRYLVTGDKAGLVALLPDLVSDYEGWEQERQLPTGLFWQYDVRDAMEESISGGRKVKNVRPTINSYMYGNARSLAEIARLADKPEIATRFDAKAKELRQKTQDYLWNAEAKFFEVRREDGSFANVREAIGFIPWYFHLPAPRRDYAEAWRQLSDPEGFSAPFGITTAERRHPEFRSHGVGGCEWDGAVWPYATSQTLVAFANALRDYPWNPLSCKEYFDAFRTYVKSHRYDGLPYLGEYQDEKTGAWLKGKDPRSRWYNHSTFADLVITGLVGLRPADSDTLAIQPLVPPDVWDWFCLDGVKYHGRIVTVLWDKDGKRYGRGSGLTVLVEGAVAAHSATLGPITVKISQP
jgi:hypothetical protein